MSNDNRSGIYVLTNGINGKVYVGSAIMFKRRWNTHLGKLRAGKHYNPYLQSAWNKYGEKAFSFQVVEYCSPDDLLEREQYWLDHYRSYKRENGYNLCSVAGSRLGVTVSEETRLRMSLANLGKTLSEEHRANISLSLTGKPRSEETKAKMSAFMTGKKLSEETRAKLSASHVGKPSGMKGKKHSDATRARISAVQIGRKASEETRRKMSVVRKGRKLSAEHKAKIGASNKMGMTPQRRAKIVTAALAREAEKRMQRFLTSCQTSPAPSVKLEGETYAVGETIEE